MALDAKGKPPKDPPDDPDPVTELEGGLVYFEDYDWVYELDMDTQSLRPLFEINWEFYNYYNTNHTPSDLNHPISLDRNGRWFLVETEVPEDGHYPTTEWRSDLINRRSIFAVNEDGVAFRLIQDPDIEPCNIYAATAPRWVNNDTEVWFLARELDADGEIVPDKYGVYHVGIEILPDGNVSVTDPEIVPFSPILEITTAESGNAYAMYVQIDVSPDGNSLFYTRALSFANPPIPLFRKDLNINGEETLIYPVQDFWISVEYSPEEDAILGKSELGLTRVQGDGANPIPLATGDRRTQIGNAAVWSPSGGQVLHSASKTVKGKSVGVLKVITSDDGSDVEEVLEMSGIPLGWFRKN